MLKKLGEIFGAEVTMIEKYALLKVESYNFSIINNLEKMI